MRVKRFIKKSTLWKCFKEGCNLSAWPNTGQTSHLVHFIDTNRRSQSSRSQILSFCFFFLSPTGRTRTCRWILLHSSVDFNHMICFCFLCCRCHNNLVYGCPGQQVKHRTPKQKGEENSPSPLNKCIFPFAQERQHGGDITCEESGLKGISFVCLNMTNATTYSCNLLPSKRLLHT